MKSTLKKIGGILLVIVLFAVMWFIASIPTMLMEPKEWPALTLGFFSFMAIFVVEIWLLVIILGTFANRKLNESNP